MIGIKILDSNRNPIAIFEPGFQESALLSMDYTKLLDGIGTGSFSVPTSSEMRQYLTVNNIVEIIEFNGCNGAEFVIWRGWIRPSTKICNNTSIFYMNETRDILQNKIIKSNGEVTNITDALNLIGLPHLLNLPDITFTGIDYRVGMTAYTLLEEIRKVTGYNYDYDGSTITYGRLGTDRVDIGFSNTGVTGGCKQCEGDFYIDNICAEPTAQYDKVIAYNGDLLAESGTGQIEISISSEANNISDLQMVADEYLLRGKPGRVITFDARKIPAGVVNVGDYIDISIQGLDDSRNVDTQMFVVKTEGLLDGCGVTTRVYVSEERIIYKDDYNVIGSLASRIQNLETR